MRPLSTRDDQAMGRRIPVWVLGSRLRGHTELIAVIVRVVAGLFIALAGVGKFADHAKEVHDFRGFGVPLADVAVPLAGAIELVGGVLVIIGFLTRPAALAIALNLVVALLTAGINEGGTFHLVVGPTLMAIMLFFVWCGAGPPSIDARLVRLRATTTRPNR